MVICWACFGVFIVHFNQNIDAMNIKILIIGFKPDRYSVGEIETMTRIIHYMLSSGFIVQIVFSVLCKLSIGFLVVLQIILKKCCIHAWIDIVTVQVTYLYVPSEDRIPLIYLVFFLVNPRLILTVR